MDKGDSGINEHNFDIKLYSVKGSESLSDEHFLLEFDNFNTIINLCPKNRKEFNEYYENKLLVITDLNYSGELVGYRICEKISNTHAHNAIIVLNPKFRNRNLGRYITSISNSYLHFLGYLFVSEFSIHGQNSLRFYSPTSPISFGKNLDSKEIKLLRNLEKKRNRKFGTLRVIKGYYKENEGIKDATFLAFRLGNKS